jgi:hypothetical protein
MRLSPPEATPRAFASAIASTAAASFAGILTTHNLQTEGSIHNGSPSSTLYPALLLPDQHLHTRAASLGLQPAGTLLKASDGDADMSRAHRDRGLVRASRTRERKLSRGIYLEVLAMGMMSQAIHDAAVSSKKAGGSFGTQQNRRFDTTGLLRFARQVGELRASISELPAWVILAYAQYCMAHRKAAGTLANIFSAIRVTSGTAGHNIDKACGNRELRLTRRVRKGTKRAQTPIEIEQLLARARRIDNGLTHLISLALYLGLRRKEALMCPRDLEMWLDALTRGEPTLQLMLRFTHFLNDSGHSFCRKIRYISVISWSARKPRHMTVGPGGRSCLRFR